MFLLWGSFDTGTAPEPSLHPAVPPALITDSSPVDLRPLLPRLLVSPCLIGQGVSGSQEPSRAIPSPAGYLGPHSCTGHRGCWRKAHAVWCDESRLREVPGIILACLHTSRWNPVRSCAVHVRAAQFTGKRLEPGGIEVGTRQPVTRWVYQRFVIYSPKPPLSGRKEASSASLIREAGILTYAAQRHSARPSSPSIRYFSPFVGHPLCQDIVELHFDSGMIRILHAPSLSYPLLQPACILHATFSREYEPVD